MVLDVDADRSFLEFRSSGDPEAMARVFDLTAPKLLLVAMHVMRHGPSAEDLVQTTFLQAIEDAASFDPARPVLPWLTSILVHRARDLRRKEQRRAADSLDGLHGGQEPASRAGGPLERAVDQEFVAEVSRAVDRLPAIYRDALVLRLVHGLTALEIAHALGRAPGTVRMQMSRGLELLRSALPKGLAVPATLVLTKARGLAAVRAEVLAALPGAAIASAGVITVVGALLMKKVVVGVACLLLLCATLLLVAHLHEAEPAGPARIGAGSLAAGPPSKTAALESPPGASAGEAARSLREPTGSGEHAIPATTIRGRCVDAASRAPLAGCVAEVRTWPARPTAVGEEAAARFEVPAPFVTGGDGRFVVSLRPPEELRFRLDLRGAQRVGVAGYWEHLPAGEEIDLGDVVMDLGTEVRLTALDDRNSPIAGARVQVDLADTSMSGASFRVRSPPLFEADTRLGNRTSDAEGRFELLVLPPGRWRILAYDVAHDYVGPRLFKVSEADRSLEVTVRFANAPRETTISGTVLDERRTPISGLELQATSADGSRGHQITRTRADGRFAFPRLAMPGPLRMAVPSKELRYRLLEPTATYAIGSSGVEVHVRTLREVPIELEVVDGATGRPVERFAHRVFPDPWTRSLYEKPYAAFIRSPVSEHAGGRVRLEGVREGRWRVSVWPEDQSLAPCIAVPFDVPPGSGGPERVRAELRRPAMLQVSVRDSAARAVPGSRVQLLYWFGPGTARDENVVTLREAEHGSALETVLLVLLDEAVADGEGRVELAAPPYPCELALKVTGPEHLPAFVAGVRTDAPVQVIVEPAARIHGRVEPLELVTAYDERHERASGSETGALSVQAQRLRRDALSVLFRRHGVEPSADLRALVGADGTFALAGLPSGTWDARLRLGTGTSAVLASIDVQPGRQHEVVLRAPQLLPARFTGIALIDGRPSAGEVGLCLVRDGTGGVTARPGADGRFDFRAVQPGEYLAWLKFFDDAHNKVLPVQVWSREPLRLVRGERSETTLHFRRTAIRLRVLQADGQTPVTNRLVHLRPLGAWLAEHAGVGGRPLDGDGALAVDPAPPGPLEVSIGPLDRPEERTVLGTIEPLAGEREARFTLTLRSAGAQGR